MVRMPVVPWPRPMNRRNSFSSPRQPPPLRCAQAPAEAYARLAGSGNRLPVLDSEAPKLPIHTAIAVPQYGTQGSVGHLAALPIWRLSPLRTWIPATLGSATASDPPPQTQSCAMSANYVLVLVNRLAGACHGLMPRPGRPPGPAPPRTPRRSSGGRRRWDADSRSHQPDPPNQAGHGLCRVKAQSRGFAAQVNGCETAADLYVCCLLLSLAVPQVPPSCGPSAAHPGCARPVGLRSVPDPLSNLCSVPWFGGDLARPGLGPADRGAAGAVRGAARRRPGHHPRGGRQRRALPPRRRHQALEPDAA
jgi:hypothetical protein